VAAGNKVITLAKDTFNEFNKDEATWKAAALSYFTVFALAPLLVLLLQVASFIWDPAQVRDALTGQFQALMGSDVAKQVETMMTTAEQKSASGSGFRLILSIGGLLFGATGAFVSLQTALNRAWEVEPDPKSGGIRNFITKRFLSLGMVLGIAFLLLVSLAVTAAMSAVGGALFGGLGKTFGEILNFILTFAVITLLFGAMFKVLPDAKIGWRDVWVGAIATALMFVVGKTLIGLYIGQSDPGSAFGAAGSLAVLLVWIYYAAVILLLGAEFTQAWMKIHGRIIEPEEGAVRIVEVKKEVGGASNTHRGDGDNSKHDGSKERSRDDGAKRDRAPDRMPDAPERKKSRNVVRAQDELDETRERMSETVAALETRVGEMKDEVKEKLDPTRLVQEHPLAALAAAVVAGVALSATGADEKAAEATVQAAKKGLATAANNGDGDGGILQRARASVVRTVENRTGELVHDIRRASEEIGRSA
jgi:membrane protein